MQKVSPGIEPGTYWLLKWSLRPLSYVGWCCKGNWNLWFLTKVILDWFYFASTSPTYRDHCGISCQTVSISDFPFRFTVYIQVRELWIKVPLILVLFWNRIHILKHMKIKNLSIIMITLFILLLTNELVTSFSLTGYHPQQSSSAQADKVCIFWEGHKNMKKSPSWFDVYLVILFNFWGILRIYEL